MKKYVLLSIIFSFLIPAAVFADIIYLKAGGSVECVIEEETGDSITAVVSVGRLNYPKGLIASISKAGAEENMKLEEKWEAQKRQREAEQEKRRKFTDEQEAKGLVLYNGQWLTKEEYEALTKPKAEENKKTVIREKPRKPPEVKQEEEKPLKFVDTVRYQNEADKRTYSYAVRLPSKYNSKIKWPVLFCFDPDGNGEGAARRFAYAAENLGWIVAGSLDAKNGPWEPIMSAQEAMFKDISKRFSVDEKRYYAAGFSGGARMSFLIAYKHPDQFKGVVACGAGFPDIAYRVSKNVAVYRCAGKKDPNLQEVRDLFGKLRLAGAKEHLQEFEGGHEWPPSDVISQALDWLAKQ